MRRQAAGGAVATGGPRRDGVWSRGSGGVGAGKGGAGAAGPAGGDSRAAGHQTPRGEREPRLPRG